MSYRLHQVNLMSALIIVSLISADVWGLRSFSVWIKGLKMPTDGIMNRIVTKINALNEQAQHGISIYN